MQVRLFGKISFIISNTNLLGITIYSSGFSLKYHYDNNGFLNKIPTVLKQKQIFEDNLSVSEQFIDAFGRYRNYTLGNGLNSEINYKNGFQYPESFMGGNVFNQAYVFDAPTGN